MADTNHSVPVRFPDRSVTIRESFRSTSDFSSRTGNTNWEPNTYASMRIRGKWLEEAGFAPPQRVRIEVTLGRLVLTPIAEEDCDHYGRDGIPTVDQTTGLRHRVRRSTKVKNKPNAVTD